MSRLQLATPSSTSHSIKCAQQPTYRHARVDPATYTDFSRREHTMYLHLSLHRCQWMVRPFCHRNKPLPKARCSTRGAPRGPGGHHRRAAIRTWVGAGARRGWKSPCECGRHRNECAQAVPSRRGCVCSESLLSATPTRTPLCLTWHWPTQTCVQRHLTGIYGTRRASAGGRGGGEDMVSRQTDMYQALVHELCT